MTLNKIKAILFDLDGTLRHHIPTGDEVFLSYLKSLGLNISDEEALRAVHWEHYYFAHSPEIQQDSKTFKDDSKGFWINYSKRRLVALGLHQKQAVELAPAVSAFMGENYKPEAFVPEEARMVLTTLQEAGYILGVVSNRDEPFQDELKRLNLDSYFRFCLAGGEVNSFKPDAHIFKRALELAGTSAEETMYVGDNYFADVVGAHRSGLLPVLFDPGQVFPDAECLVIKSFDELLPLVSK